MRTAAKSYHTEILIVGAGGCAVTAATEATKHGIKLLIVCKDTFLAIRTGPPVWARQQAAG